MTPQEWNELPQEALDRGQLRTLQLFLQAAHREGLLPPASCRDGQVRWSHEGTVLCVQGALEAHGSRLQLRSMAWLEDGQGKEPLDLATTIRVAGVFAGTYRPGSAWESLIRELEEAAHVQAAAYLAAEDRPQPRSAAEFETWTPEGHNLHPGAKTRQGFTPTDMLAYAPDFSSTLELPWIAVSKSLLSRAGQIPPAFELDERTWCLPVHPWQRQRVLPGIYDREWGEGLLRDLDRPPVLARLSTSLRTVDPVDETLPILKLSVGSLMTSTERSMSRHTARQGPIYSAILRQAMAENPAWAANVELMQENGGLFWSDENDQGPRSRQLSLVLRQRPTVPARGVAIPCSTLPQPLAGEPSATTVMAQLFSRGPGPLANLRRYCKLLIPAHLGLYQSWGIALEGHLQNCLVVWSESGPERLCLRDWGGLRVDRAALARRVPELTLQLDPSSVTVSDAASARRKLIACLYPNHLTEIVVGLARSLGLPEQTSWDVVREISSQALRGTPDRELARHILEQPWPVKALLRMRLGADGGDIYSSLPNPLAASPRVIRALRP